MNETSLHEVIQTLALPDSSEPTTLPVTVPVATGLTTRAVSQILTAKQPITGGYVRYTGADYPLEYPAGWSTNVTVLPLYECRHTMQGCTAASANNPGQELRMYYPPMAAHFFYSSIMKTERDIWPRNLHGDVVYEDIINSVLGNPDTCANSPEVRSRLPVSPGFPLMASATPGDGQISPGSIL